MARSDVPHVISMCHVQKEFTVLVATLNYDQSPDEKTQTDFAGH